MRNGWGLNVRTMIVVAANHEGKVMPVADYASLALVIILKMEGCRYVINTFVDLRYVYALPVPKDFNVISCFCFDAADASNEIQQKLIILAQCATN
ncbi:hypothetical protein BDFB_005899 [Asbolus verrucosus]|uniref:Uncharacterized protein n=1 Tax=Asbolus verrucosus TaxID=1661398 RepID=A0A482VEQ5_ASBVE|nr:hypothetical protein BDFB_005899 [Asbolus verrucosus]